MNETIPIRVKMFVAVTAAIGAWILGTSFLHWHSHDPREFFCYLLIALAASTMKVRLPGMESTMSVHFLFILLGILELSLPETLVIGCSAALVQSLCKTTRRPQAIKVVFNVLSMSPTAIWLTYVTYQATAGLLINRRPLLLLIASCAYFLSNTVPVSIVIALSDEKSIWRTWKETYFWSFPYYLAGAAVVGFISYLNSFGDWQSAFLTLPIMYGIYRSFHLYLGRLENEKKRAELESQQVVVQKGHIEEISALQMRTIEALTLAIDTKDHTTSLHLNRVSRYVEQIGKDLGLNESDLKALQAAALLHDIGKLAVPDHIINKPGRLTPEEFEKVKIHPAVGAAILEKIAFPYPVAPIVRAHHEKWNGTGYPDGLKAEEIPLGARILAVVDCLDSLASDRQYRRALPLDEAMKVIADEAGKSFDPKVVEILQLRYRELESEVVGAVREARSDLRGLSFSERKCEGPDAGFELGLNRHFSNQSDFLSFIASARQEAHTLFELCQDLGNSLSLDESLSLVAMRLRRLVPYDSIAVFIPKGNSMVPEFASGENSRYLLSLEVPLGKGLCGWVAQNLKPIVNGNPAVEEDFADCLTRTVESQSALSLPLLGITEIVGVLTLYKAEKDAFNADHLRVLQVITSKLAHTLENALRYRQAETAAVIDHLTGIPNARGLSIRLEEELSRCEREHGALAVIVCDLNGFKSVNDRYGHLAGDEVLKLFVKLMQESCRSSDFLARMGGDEFVILAPGMTQARFRKSAIEINAIARKAGQNVGGEEVLSVSSGAAFYPEDGSEAGQLLFKADKAMYEAKLLRYKQRETASILERAVLDNLEQQFHLETNRPLLN